MKNIDENINEIIERIKARDANSSYDEDIKKAENELKKPVQILKKDEQNLKLKMEKKIEKALKNEYVKNEIQNTGYGKIDDIFFYNAYKLKEATKDGLLNNSSLKITENNFKELTSLANKYFNFLDNIDADGSKLNARTFTDYYGETAKGYNITIEDTQAFLNLLLNDVNNKLSKKNKNEEDKKMISRETLKTYSRRLEKINLILNIAINEKKDYTSQVIINKDSTEINNVKTRNKKYLEEDYLKVRKQYAVNGHGGRKKYEKVSDTGVAADLCWNFGFRPDTVFKLTLEDIDINNLQFKIPASKVKSNNAFTIKAETDVQIELIKNVYERTLKSEKAKKKSIKLEDRPIITINRTSIYETFSKWEKKAGITIYKDSNTKFNAMRKSFVENTYRRIRRDFNNKHPDDVKGRYKNPSDYSTDGLENYRNKECLKAIAKMMGYKNSDWRIILYSYVTFDLGIWDI